MLSIHSNAIARRPLLFTSFLNYLLSMLKKNLMNLCSSGNCSLILSFMKTPVMSTFGLMEEQ